MEVRYGPNGQYKDDVSQEELEAAEIILDKAKIKCPGCGISVPDVPEDSVYEEGLCNRCYDLENAEKGRNTNCLEGMKCPECGSLEPFGIVVTLAVRLWDTGIDSTEDIEGDYEWDDDSWCSCRNCNKTGRVRDFKEARQ